MDYVIHAGLPKTGSTSIQRFLKVNQAALLRDASTYYPVGLLGGSAQHGEFVSAVSSGEIERAANFIAQGLAQAKAASAVLTVWSAEKLSSLRKSEYITVRRLLEEHGEPDRIRIILYFRNLYDRAASWLTQTTKNGEWPVEFEAIDRKILRNSPSKKVRAFERAFGEDNVEVRVFETALSMGLEQDFCAAAGIRWSDSYELAGLANLSPDLITAELFNMIRMEFGVHQGALDKIVANSPRMRLPTLTARFLDRLEPHANGFDISHPKLAAHKDVLLRKAKIDPAQRPTLAEFCDHLDRFTAMIRQSATVPAGADGDDEDEEE